MLPRGELAELAETEEKELAEMLPHGEEKEVAETHLPIGNVSSRPQRSVGEVAGEDANDTLLWLDGGVSNEENNDEMPAIAHFLKKRDPSKHRNKYPRLDKGPSPSPW